MNSYSHVCAVMNQIWCNIFVFNLLIFYHLDYLKHLPIDSKDYEDVSSEHLTTVFVYSLCHFISFSKHFDVLI